MLPMKLGQVDDNHPYGLRKEMRITPAAVSFAILPVAVIMVTLMTLQVYYPSILDVNPQFDIKSADAASTGAATTAKNPPPNVFTTENSTIRTYVNPVFGINLQYPSAWSAFELNSKYRDNVTYAVALLRAPLDNASDKYAEKLNFGMQKLKLNNVTLNAYTTAILNSYKNTTGVNILDSSPATLAGQPAHSVVYTDDRVDGFKLKKYQIWSVLNNSKAYVVTFGSEQSKYGKYLPQVQNIIKSFKVSSNSSDNPQEKRDLVFDDPTSGIKLQYPSSWTKAQLGQPLRRNVDLVGAFFHRENQNTSSLSRIGVAVQPLRSQDVKLDQYTSNQLNAIKKVNATGIEDKETKVGANPAHDAVFSLNGTKVMQMWTLKGDKAFIFAYQANPNEYAANLPTFQKMVDSVEIK
jgi:hypothetical protein